MDDSIDEAFPFGAFLGGLFSGAKSFREGTSWGPHGTIRGKPQVDGKTNRFSQARKRRPCENGFKKKINKPVFVAYIKLHLPKGVSKSECPFSFARWISYQT